MQLPKDEFAKAEEIFEDVLERRKRILGESHGDVGASLNDIATACFHQGKLPRAKELYERALALHEARFGPDHPQTANVLANLSALHRLQTNYSDALQLLERAVEIWRRSGSEASVAMGLNNLATLHHAIGDRDSQKLQSRCEALLRESLETTRRLCGPEHPSTATAMTNLAILLLQIRPHDAEPMLRHALRT